jgi:hypothetical protein
VAGLTGAVVARKRLAGVARQLIGRLN